MSKAIRIARKGLVLYIGVQLVNEIYRQSRKLEKQDKLIAYLANTQKAVFVDMIQNGLISPETQQKIVEAGTDLKFEDIVQDF